MAGDAPDDGLADRIAEARGIAGLSQRALADAAGVDRAEIGRYEARRRRPRADRLARLADAMDVDRRWLVTGSGDPRAGRRSHPAEEQHVRELLEAFEPAEARARIDELERKLDEALELLRGIAGVSALAAGDDAAGGSPSGRDAGAERLAEGLGQAGPAPGRPRPRSSRGRGATTPR